jgi:hypothetical protein
VIKLIQKDARAHLPLKIRVAWFERLYLHLHGDDWTFNSDSPWRVTEAGRMIWGYGDATAGDHINELVGSDIIAIVAQSLTLKADPVFILSDGRKLEVFSDQYLEPWVMELPGMNVFVALPSDPRYVE